MHTNSVFRLISKGKEYTIPSNFPSIADVNPEIYNNLITKGEYEIKSNVTENILKSFINHWLTGQPPEFQYSNIFIFLSLSSEFDRMKDLTEMYIKYMPDDECSEFIRKQSLLKEQIQTKKLASKGQSDKYQKIISILFKHEQIGKLVMDKEKLFKSCLNKQENLVMLNCQKKIKINGLLYNLNFKEKEATLSGYEEVSSDLFIPRSIRYKNDEFIVTKIIENLYSKSDEIKTVTFEENSELRSIGEKSFSSLLIESITIPSKVKIIEKESFHSTRKLKTIEFEKNSELETIKDALFSSSSIENILFPEKLKKISRFTFLYCQHLKKVDFTTDSELKTIEKSAFYNSSIERISIPSSIIEFQEGWCDKVFNLNDIRIIQRNVKNIDYYDNKFLIGKSNLENDFFDVLLFARRDIENATIPSFIRRIAPYSFSNCYRLKKVDFQENSQIQIIDVCAFENSSLESISIPSSLIRIGANSFDNCKLLNNVTFSKNTKLLSIDEHAFSRSSISKIKFPYVEIINLNAFAFCMKLKKVSVKSGLKYISSSIFNESAVEKVTFPSSIINVFQWWYKAFKLTNIKVIECHQKNVTFYDKKFLISKTNIHSENYDFLHFVRRDIENVTIPSFVKKIDQFAFENCTKLKSVNFSDDSKIECICKNGFARSGLERISFPSHLKMIESNAFSSCYNLKSIEFPENSQLESIGVYSFGFTSIENVCLPAHLKKICKNSFSDCKKLQKVSFAKNSEIKIIEKYSFYNSSIESLSIPSSIEFLEDGWPSKTNFLTNIEIIECEQKNILFFDEKKLILGKSDLKSDIYDVLLFARRDIKSASIPPFIKRIANYAFEYCYNIKNVYFSEDSELESFEFAFMDSSLEKIKIPSRCKNIGKYSFYQCRNLEKITFSENSQLKSIGEYAFSNCSIHSIVIPSNVSKIEKFVFANCKMLQIIEFNKNFELKTIDEKMFGSSSAIIMIHANNNNIFI